MTLARRHLAVFALWLLLAAACGPPSPPPDATMTITFLGDTGLGIEPPAQEVLSRLGDHAPFEHIRAALFPSDFVIAGHETPMADPGMEPDVRGPAPRESPRFAQVYAKERIFAFFLANNHAMDFGPEGLDRTRDALAQVGIQTFGAGMNRDEARAPLVLEKDGLKVGILAYCERWRRPDRFFAGKDRPGVAELREDWLRQDVRRLRGKVHAVVVLPHWGRIFKDVTDEQEALARAAADAGAALIVGSHPHIPQRVERVGNAAVLYSVGNFIFHGLKGDGFYPESPLDYALVARVTLDGRGARSATLVPFFNHNRMTDFIPRPAEPEKARRLFERILAPLPGKWRMEGTAAIVDLR